MSTLDNIIDTHAFSRWLDICTDTGKECLVKQLNDWKSDGKDLSSLSARFKRFKDVINKNPEFYKEIKQILGEISNCEKTINELTTKTTNLEKESYNEILFFRPILQPLNFIPYILTIWSFTRIYLLPGLSFLIPFLTLLAPYFIIRFLCNLPITINNYMQILHSMISGNINAILNPSQSVKSVGISPVAFIKQFGLVAITILQGIIQPYWSYKHLNSIDNIIQSKGQDVIRFRNLYERLSNVLRDNGFTFFKCPLPEIMNERDGVARAILYPTYFKLALKYVGSLEIILSLAKKNETCVIKWVKSKNPIYRINDTFDFNVSDVTRRKISAAFDKKRHALLTGPNKGGKSTALRALSVSALLAHTYGCAIAKSCTMTPFDKIFVCLKPDDLPGSKSRFEREIEFTAHTLTYDKPIMVFIDELYHSTNPPDALRSCNIYCGKLWNKDNILSIISTHLFELVENAPENIQRLCCQANLDSESNIQFLYNLEMGICKVSSVDGLLKDNGLL